MLISIVIPMRNAERWIGQTLRSLLDQRGSFETEIIVIDDGSTDRSAEAVRSLGRANVRLLAGPQKGISAAFNTGLAAAQGEYLCRCDADDLYPPDRLAWQVKFLQEHPDFGAICGRFATIDESGRRVADHFADHPAGDVTHDLLAGHGRSHMCAYLFRTELLRKIGGCREWFVTSEDADLQYRLAEITRVAYEPHCAYLYRIHNASITHAQKDALRRFYEDEARRFLAQRRAGQEDDLQRGVAPPLPTAGNTEAKTRSASVQIQELLLGQAWREHALGHKRRSLGTGFRAIVAKPTTFRAWRSLAALLLKPSRTTIDRFTQHGSSHR
jgi:glycosyltransferase involved in cell wall biosynthesis